MSSPENFSAISTVVSFYASLGIIFAAIDIHRSLLINPKDHLVYAPYQKDPRMTVCGLQIAPCPSI